MSFTEKYGSWKNYVLHHRTLGKNLEHTHQEWWKLDEADRCAIVEDLEKQVAYKQLMDHRRMSDAGLSEWGSFS